MYYSLHLTSPNPSPLSSHSSSASHNFICCNKPHTYSRKFHTSYNHLSCLTLLQTPYTFPTPSLHTSYTLPTHSQHLPYTLPTPSLHTPYTLTTNSLYIPYILPTHSLYTPYTLPTPSLHLPYTLPTNLSYTPVLHPLYPQQSFYSIHSL